MQPLTRLLRPRSIAVIGGGTWCANVVAACRKIGFAGPVWPVHPTRDSVGGLAAHPTVDALPGAPDAAFVAVNREATVEAVRALSARGAGGAVCFASGFREAAAEIEDGQDLEAALVAAAGEMPIVGPNCYGFLNLFDGAALWPDQHGGLRTERGVALIAQSSNIALNLTMQARGLPIGYVVTVGNQAQTGLDPIALALLDDPRVTALGLHVEGVGDLAGFEAMAARARALSKPVVVLKSGLSEAAQVAAVSHTGALAGSGAGAAALFDRLGIGQVESLSDLLETLKILHVAGPLPSNRIASMSCSGGEAGLMADHVARLDLCCPPLTDGQRTALRAALGPRVALANPLDYHTYVWGDRDAIARTFTAMMAPHLALGVVVLDFPRPDRCDGAPWEIVVDAVADTAAATGRPMAILSSLPETLPEARARAMMDRGIVPLCGMAEGLRAVELAARLGAAKPAPPPLLRPGPKPAPRLLSEAEAKALLARSGVGVPRSATAATPAEAARAAAGIGFPVVLKALGVAHKTGTGAIALNLAAPEDVARAAAPMAPAALLVEEMVAGGLVELLVGVVRDDAHGFVLTLGAGGTVAELLSDTVSLLVPAPRPEVDAALGRLRLAPLLAGYRGSAPAARDAVLDAIMAVQDVVIGLADRLAELEINPLIVTADCAVAADALIRMGEDP